MGRDRVEAGGVVAAARAGDESAFGALVESYRPELQVHCYRMLGSFEDSEDLVQETFLRAWRKRRSFQGRSTFRAWLYQIATNACLDALQRRPRVAHPHGAGQPLTEIPWLQPYPDRLLEGIAPREDEPEAEVVARETIELTFIAAIQLLPPKQRVALIARDVLGWSAVDALQRARATLKQRLPRRRLDWAAGSVASAEERALLKRYIDASEHPDPAAMVELLREDALFAMPPEPEWWVGREAIVASWVEGGGFDPSRFGRFRCVATRVNMQPAVANYVRRPGDTEYRAMLLDVLRVEEGLLAEIVTFPIEPFLGALGLPQTL